MVSALIILFIIVLLIGVIFYVDSLRLSTALKGPREIFVEDDGKILSGASISTTNIKVKQLLKARFFKSYNDEGIVAAQIKYDEKTLFDDEKNLVILLNPDYLVKGQTLVLEDFEKELNNQEMKDIIKSSTFEEASEIILSGSLTIEQEKIMKEKLEENYNDLSELKSDIMISALAQQLKNNQKKFLLDGVKSGDIIIHPNFISVQIYRFLPKSLASIIIKEE